MNCVEFENGLSDYLEGAHSSERQAHLNSCSMCSGLLADLNLISAEAPLLREVEEPSPRVWNALEAQLRREGLIGGPAPSARPSRADFFVRWRTAWLLPAAAALLIAAGVKLYHPAKVGDNQSIAKETTLPNPTSQAAVSTEDKQILSTVAARPPAQVAAYRTDLDQANAFIRDAQDVLKNNPNDVYSEQLLINAYEQKQMLYRLATDDSAVGQSNDEQ